MQSVAFHLGVPTTAFLVPDTSRRHRIRWFTPRKELNLCGHATIASACYLYDVAGVPPRPSWTSRRAAVRCATRQDRYISLDLPRMEVVTCQPPEGLAAALGALIVRCARAVDDIVVELESERAVATLRPDFAALARIECRGHVVTARAEQQSADFVSRSFFPALGVDEDQVCVSAHCKLGPYWGQRLDKQKLTGIQLSARGGRLEVHLDGQRVHVAGEARVRQCIPSWVWATGPRSRCAPRHANPVPYRRPVIGEGLSA